jgi:WD40-like Beta Propeller Repeat
MHLAPSFLSDGRRVLYLRVSRSNPSGNGLYIADRDRPPEEQSTERLLETGFTGAYAQGSHGPDRILFVRDRALWAVPFDATRLALAGDPVQVAPRLSMFRDGAAFSASAKSLVYRGPASEFQLTWRDRQGTPLGNAGEPGPFIGVVLSPDAARAILVRENRLNRADQDLWLLDMESDSTTRFTADPLLESVPAWSADGQSLMFALGSRLRGYLGKACEWHVGPTAACVGRQRGFLRQPAAHDDERHP